MERKATSGIMVTLLLIVLFFGTWMTGDVRAHAPGVSLSAWTLTPPNIDGTIEPSEWASADVISFTTPNGLLPGRTGILYVMNDAANLYLAVAMPDTTPDINDQFRFYFDNDHDGIFEKGDDCLKILGVRAATVASYWDLHWNPDVPGWAEDWYPAYGIYGTFDGSGDANNIAGINYFEFSHPLDSTDDAYDFSLSEGETVGFALGYYDDGSSVGWFPGMPGNPGDYGDIKIASLLLPRTIDELKTKIEKLSSESQVDNQGVVKSLIAKLNTAHLLVDNGRVDEARTVLEGFVNQVRKLSGIHITVEAADILIKSAEYIMSHL